MTFSCRVQRKSRDRKKFSILMHKIFEITFFRGPIGVGSLQMFILNRYFAIDSRDIDRTINLAIGNSVISF